MMAKVYTIGYAGIQLPQFIDVLLQNGATNIIAKRNGVVLYESKAETEKRINGDYDKQAAKIEYKV